MKLLTVCAITLCLCLHSGIIFSADVQNTFVIGVWHIAENKYDMPEIEAILVEAYRRIGATVTFKCLPPKRDLVWANNDEIDACAIRAKVVLRNYPNLVEVPVPLLHYSLCAFTANPGITIHNGNDLRGHSVGVTIGKISDEVLLQRYGVNYQTFVSPISAVPLLLNGRLDVFVHDCLSCKSYLQQLQLENIASHPLYTGYAYHIINRKHENIIPKLSDAFTSMIQDGTMKRLAGRLVEYLPDRTLSPRLGQS
ncbi:conserved uncharacterized protein, related to ABC transporter [Desulfosarcina variabilis str. Montpellier]